MRVAFIVDPLDQLKAYKDSSVAMMREAQLRGHEVWTLQREALCWDQGRVEALAVAINLGEDDAHWYQPHLTQRLALTDFDAVVMRQDPPFDFEYVCATWLLERARAEGACIFNDPRAIRDHSEKIAITEFPQFIAPTLVARQAEDLDRFIDQHGDCVLKPLDGMGGSRVFRVGARDPNRNVIVETLTELGTRSIMAQRYLPAIREGDKRVLLIDGEPVPYALARIPKEGETRGNLAAGGRGEARALTEREREIAAVLGPVLRARGLLLVGLDVIGDCLTEINVTSPTCFVEITQQTGCHVAGLFIDALERAAAC